MDHVEHGTATSTSKTIISLPDGITVREYKHSDIKPISHHANNKKVWNNLRDRFPHPYTEEKAEWWINFCHDSANQVRSGPWTPEKGSSGPAVSTNYVVTINDEPVGAIGLDFADDIYFRSAELGYWLGEEYWGKGIMSKVVPAFVSWGWETFGILIRINGATHEGNAASGKLLEKAGFRHEGRREKACCKNGIIAAEDMWGALRPECVSRAAA